MTYLGLLKLAAPETLVVVAALVVLAVDLTTMRELDTRVRFIIGGLIGGVGCVAAILWMLVMPAHANAFGGMLVVDPLTQFVKIALLALTIFISLELTSLSLYILTAFHKRNIKSAEAALKYFLFGGMAAAFTLFGLSLLYGIAGSTNLGEIAKAVGEKALHAAQSKEGGLTKVFDPLLVVALVMTVIGFGFKVAAVPFHLWAPDAYEGAPAPSAAFIASGSKLASFFIFAKVMMLGFKGAEGSGAWQAYATGWVPVLAIVAAASM